MNPLPPYDPDLNGENFTTTEFPQEQGRARRLSLEEGTPLADRARKVPFPSWGDWFNKISVNGENTDENDKIPEEFREDVKLATRTFPWDKMFEKMDHTVCFNIRCGQVHLRLWGAYKLEEAIHKLGLTLVKVPRQIYWVYKEEKGFLFAQKIISRSAKITADEMREIKALIDATGFTDYGRDSLIAGEEGIFFVDLGDDFNGRGFNYSDFWRSSVLKQNPGFDEEALELIKKEAGLY